MAGAAVNGGADYDANAERLAVLAREEAALARRAHAPHVPEQPQPHVRHTHYSHAAKRSLQEGLRGGHAPATEEALHVAGLSPPRTVAYLEHGLG